MQPTSTRIPQREKKRETKRSRVSGFLDDSQRLLFRNADGEMDQK